MKSLNTEEDIKYIKVFTPYNQYNHVAYYAYDAKEYGVLKFGTVVKTSMGVGAIIDTDVDENKLPNVNIVDIYRLANEKEVKLFNKDWWQHILEISDKIHK